MGWKIFKTTNEWRRAGSPASMAMKVSVLDQIPHFKWPSYTTDPAAAMEVLKKCAENQHVVTIEYAKNHLGNWQWMVAKLHCYSSGYSEDFCTCAETLELAICQFARKLFSK
jgi:hypothetical protein